MSERPRAIMSASPRAKIASGGENSEALNRAEAVVRKLTAAINDEVRSLDT